MVVHLILQSLSLYVKTHIAPKNHRRADNLTPMSAPTQESLIEYPCLFPIKVMGLQVDGFIHAVTYVAKQFDPTFDASTIELRESKGGKYLGVTITVTATSRDQLDALYQTLSTHPMVKVVL
jgi:putative lipoic acid-binding regulatory protein